MCVNIFYCSLLLCFDVTQFFSSVILIKHFIWVFVFYFNSFSLMSALDFAYTFVTDLQPSVDSPVNKSVMYVCSKYWQLHSQALLQHSLVLLPQLHSWWSLESSERKYWLRSCLAQVALWPCLCSVVSLLTWLLWAAPSLGRWPDLCMQLLSWLASSFLPWFPYMMD